ncbi:MAG: ABC transporter permease [Actinobacteria bacterium]|nr:ABC transporter permease [Actinomycetota bacterium]MBV9932935.1 ABC transporter permease [Actinomycetota bacterium]
MSSLFSYIVLGSTRGLIYGILALGLVLTYKGTRVLNLAQPFFGLLGAFVCWWLTAEAGFMPFAAGSRPRMLVALVVTLAVVGAQAVGLERFLFRTLRRAPRLVTLVATLAIGQAVLGVVVVLFVRGQGQAEKLRVIPLLVHGVVQLGHVNLTGGDLQILALVPLVGIELALFFRLSRFGVAIRAAAENADSARLLGISVDKVATFSWVLGLMLAALAGILLASEQGTLALSTLSTGFLVRALAAALIGGLTSLPGALVGGLVVGISEATISGTFRGTVGAADAVFFVAVVAMLIFRPQGIFGQREDTEDKVAFVPPVRELPARLAKSVYAVAVSRVTIATLIAFALVVSLVTGSATNSTLTLVCVGAIVGVSLTVLMGYAGQISLGHWALVGVGAFAATDLHGRLGVPFLLTVPLVVVIGMVVSLLIGLPALRIKGLYLAVVTLTFSYAAEFFVFRSDVVGGGQTGRVMPIPSFGPFDLDSPSNRPLFVVALGVLLLSIWVARNLLTSRTGRTFAALRENEKAAATLGVSLTKARLMAFAVSGGMAALGGVVFALHVKTVNATDFPTETSLVLVLMVMIGGLGRLSGSWLGAFAVFGVPLLFKFDNAWIIPVATGLLSVAVIVRTQGGLAGLVQRGRHAVVETLVDLDQSGEVAPAHLSSGHEPDRDRDRAAPRPSRDTRMGGVAERRRVVSAANPE